MAILKSDHNWAPCFVNGGRGLDRTARLINNHKYIFLGIGCHVWGVWGAKGIQVCKSSHQVDRVCLMTSSISVCPLEQQLHSPNQGRTMCHKSDLMTYIITHSVTGVIVRTCIKIEIVKTYLIIKNTLWKAQSIEVAHAVDVFS